VTLVKKQVLAPATYWIDGRPVKFTKAHVRSIGLSSQQAVKDGLPIRFPKEHQDYALPIDHPDRLAADVNYNKGFIQGYFIDRSDDSLWMSVEVPDKKFASRLPTEVKFVSPRIDPSFTAGNGKTYRNVITHVAATCNPIAAEQKPFGTEPVNPVELSATVLMSSLAKLHKPIFFSLADRVEKRGNYWVFVNRPGRPRTRDPKKLSHSSGANRLSRKTEVNRMRRPNGHALYLSQDGSSFEYVIEGPAVDLELEREKWLDRVSLGQKVTIEFADGSKLVGHAVDLSKADGDHGGDEGTVKLKFESGDEGWVNRSGSYGGKKISKMTAEPGGSNPEDEEKVGEEVAKSKTPTAVAMAMKPGKPDFVGGSTDGDEDEEEDGDEDDFETPDEEEESDDYEELDEDLEDDAEESGKGAPKKSGKDADFEAAKAALEEHDPPIHLPDDCDAKTGWKMLATALHAINRREESLDQDDESDEAMKGAQQEPQMVAMSAAIAKDPTVRALKKQLEMSLRQQRKMEMENIEKRFKAVVDTGRMKVETARKHLTNLAKVQMSGGENKDSLRAIHQLEFAEELPESDLLIEQTGEYKLSVPAIPEHSKSYANWGTGPAAEAAAAEAGGPDATSDLIAMANKHAG